MKNWYICKLNERVYFGKIFKSQKGGVLFDIHIQHTFDIIDNIHRVYSTQTSAHSQIAENYVKISKKALIKKLTLLGINKKVLDNVE